MIISVYALQLRLEEERCEEVEARVRELEKQVIDFLKHIVRCVCAISFFFFFNDHF